MKIIAKLVTDIHVKHKTIKLIENNRGKLGDLELSA
jgi:hypothetical protein